MHFHMSTRLDDTAHMFVKTARYVMSTILEGRVGVCGPRMYRRNETHLAIFFGLQNPMYCVLFKPPHFKIIFGIVPINKPSSCALLVLPQPLPKARFIQIKNMFLMGLYV